MSFFESLFACAKNWTRQGKEERNYTIAYGVILYIVWMG
jgi:hypothetical protein